ncbi:MAG: YitT family protein [Lactobacillales bacterium]|jgi:uncharacterized membrane-anchored protein YitT (DUF2179 family)|nr:YitT family protein [Lactobacillales bacterium]
MLNKLKKYCTPDDLKASIPKLSAIAVYAFLSSVTINAFYQPAHIYSSGLTGLAQIIDTLLGKFIGASIPIGWMIFICNLPMFIIAFKYIGKRFTLFTVMTVFASSLVMSVLPLQALTGDPIMSAVFGGATFGLGIGFCLKNGISSGGLDIIGIIVRKRTGKTIGSISMMFNLGIIILSGILFGLSNMFYSAIAIFLSGMVVDVVYTRQKKLQIMIVTSRTKEVVDEVQLLLRRGITIIHSAEGAYSHERREVLILVITRDEIPVFKKAMQVADPNAFVSISEDVKIMGNFYDTESEIR